MNKVDVVELFAGVGGFRLGLENCDKVLFNTVWANQWEPANKDQWAYKCYEYHFGACSCVNKDIATVIDTVPKHDLLVGGFPCQDYSVAHSLSTSKGIEGKKGVLWWSINEIIKNQQPPYVLLENVDRLVKSPAKQRGRDFGIILKCLYDAGYAVEWRIINAADYGCVQRRRRTFIFAAHKSTKHFNHINQFVFSNGALQWLLSEGFFAGAFPVVNEAPKGKKTITDFSNYKDLVDVSDNFTAVFYNAGLMIDGKIISQELLPNGEGPIKLESIIYNGPIDDKYFITQEDLPNWEYMKGSKRIERQSSEGYTYRFSEGAIAFPDPLDKPARTMLTSEGTKNRSTHIITDPYTGKLRKLIPDECDQINGFPKGWTDMGMPDRWRYFIMGNALVVPLIERMGDQIFQIL